jgi:hypothetical protein
MGNCWNIRVSALPLLRRRDRVRRSIGSRAIFKLSRIALRLSAAAVLVSGMAAGALAQTPTPQQLYQMLLNQQKQIKALQRRAGKAERELRNARKQLRQYQGKNAATQKTAMDAQKAADAANAKIVKIRRDGTRVARRSGVFVSLTYAKQDGAYAFGTIIALKPTHELLGLGLISPDASTPADFPGASIESIDPSYSPGVRAGFGYGFKGTGVDARLTFTNLRSNASRTLEAPAGGSISPLLINPAATNQDDAQTVIGDYRLEYFVVDAEVAQSFMIGRRLKVRFLAGLRFARIQELIQARHIGQDFGPNNGTLVTNQYTFWGAGPRIGVDVAWAIAGGLYLKTNVDGGLLIGMFDLTHRQEDFDFPIADSGFQQKEKGVVVPYVGARLAIGWSGTISKGVVLLVELGYEFQAWMGAAHKISGVDDSSEAFLVRQRDNLVLHGPFLMIKLKFENLGMLFGRR